MAEVHVSHMTSPSLLSPEVILLTRADYISGKLSGDENTPPPFTHLILLKGYPDYKVKSKRSDSYKALAEEELLCGLVL